MEIFLQYKDGYRAGIAIRNLGRLFTAWEPSGAAIEALECSAEVKEILRAVLEESKKA